MSTNNRGSRVIVQQPLNLSGVGGRKTSIQDVIELGRGRFLMYDSTSFGIVEVKKISSKQELIDNPTNMRIKTKKIIKNILGSNQQILSIQHIFNDIIGIGSANKIILYSTKNFKITKLIKFNDLTISCFLFLDINSLLLVHKHYIYKINPFMYFDTNNLQQYSFHQTMNQQPICKIYKKGNTEIIIQTFYENLHIFNLEAKMISDYFYYELPSHLFTDLVLFKNDVAVSYARGTVFLNKMNIKNGSNADIENNQIISLIKPFDREEKYISFSFSSGQISIYERKSRKQVSSYSKSEENSNQDNTKKAFISLGDNKMLVVDEYSARLVAFEFLTPENKCSIF